MPVTNGYLEYIKEQLSQVGDITYKKMMGEYLIYYKGKYIAAVCDDRLLIKPFDGAEHQLSRLIFEKPYEGAKDMLLVETDTDTEYYRDLFEMAYQKLSAVKTKADKKENDK